MAWEQVLNTGLGGGGRCKSEIWSQGPACGVGKGRISFNEKADSFGIAGGVGLLVFFDARRDAIGFKVVKRGTPGAYSVVANSHTSKASSVSIKSFAERLKHLRGRDAKLRLNAEERIIEAVFE